MSGCICFIEFFLIQTWGHRLRGAACSYFRPIYIDNSNKMRGLCVYCSKLLKQTVNSLLLKSVSVKPRGSYLILELLRPLSCQPDQFLSKCYGQNLFRNVKKQTKQIYHLSNTLMCSESPKNAQCIKCNNK